MRWKIENEGFNTQKNQGYYLEHLFSKNYQGIKNHYYLIQIGHMIAQIMETWGRLWEGMHQSMEQKHQKILESIILRKGCGRYEIFIAWKKKINLSVRAAFIL